jgi:hypothetical protein
MPTFSNQNHFNHPKENTNLIINLYRKKTNIDSYIDVKIGDYLITVKRMNDLKNGGWLNDEVRIIKLFCRYNLNLTIRSFKIIHAFIESISGKKNHILQSAAVKKLFIDGDFSNIYRKVSLYLIIC